MACSRPSACERMLGWIAAIVFPSLSGGVALQVRPPSVDRSKWTRHPLSSVLDPETRSPFASCIGLFLIGPRMPFGSRSAADQVRPPSADLMNRPHQALGLGPFL